MIPGSMSIAVTSRPGELTLRSCRTVRVSTIHQVTIHSSTYITHARVIIIMGYNMYLCNSTL